MLTPAEQGVYATVGRKHMADPPTQVPVDSERAFALIGKMHFQIIDQQGMLQAASNEIRALKKFSEGLNTKIAQLESDLKFQTGIANCQIQGQEACPVRVDNGGLVNA